MVVTRKQNTASWVKKCSFFGKLGMLCFSVITVWRFALLPYYRRLYIHFKLATLVFSTGITWEHQPDALKYSVVIISNEQVNDL